MWIFTQGTAGKRHRCLVNYFWKTESVYYSWHLGGKELELINSRGVISSCQTTLLSNFISISNLGFIGFTVEYKQSTFSRFYFNTLCDGSSKWRVIIYRLRGRAEWFWFCLCNFLMIPLPPSSLFPPPPPPFTIELCWRRLILLGSLWKSCDMWFPKIFRPPPPPTSTKSNVWSLPWLALSS